MHKSVYLNAFVIFI